jgi:hypothetical protein
MGTKSNLHPLIQTKRPTWGAEFSSSPNDEEMLRPLQTILDETHTFVSSKPGPIQHMFNHLKS